MEPYNDIDVLIGQSTQYDAELTKKLNYMRMRCPVIVCSRTFTPPPDIASIKTPFGDLDSKYLDIRQTFDEETRDYMTLISLRSAYQKKGGVK